MNEDAWIYDMMMKLSGVIYSKAMIENNFQKVYGRVFDMMADDSFMNEMNILEVLGNVGG